MLLTDQPAVVDRMLLLDEVRFDPDRIFTLDRPILLMPGDQVSLSGDQLVVSRVEGSEERPADDLAPVRAVAPARSRARCVPVRRASQPGTERAHHEPMSNT